MSAAQPRPLRTQKCPWCNEELQVAFPLLDPPPESVRLSREGSFDSSWLVRLKEVVACPICHKEIKICWSGGFRY